MVGRMVGRNRNLLILASAALSVVTFAMSGPLMAQSGLRESLEKLDRNQNGEIDPEEITPLARPYLERLAKSRRMSMGRPYDIERWQEAARIYFALQNGVAGERIKPDSEASVKSFVPDAETELVPEFGLPAVKFPYIQADLDEADRTLKRSDRNRDGYIDRAESERAVWTHRQPFEEDLNKDDRLSRLELAQRYARRRLLSGASDELVRKAGRVGNGIQPATRVEPKRQDSSQWWRRGSQYYLTATVLGRFDKNRNGRLEKDETVSLGFPPGKIDLNRDGELSREELHAYLLELQEEIGDLGEGLPGWFFELDENRDEQIAMVEFATEWTAEKIAEFTSYDGNGDGLLTASEVLNAKALVGGSYSNNDAEVLAPKKTVISEIEVLEDFVIGDLNLRLSITHSHTSYLDAYLTGPDGQRIELFTEVGGHDDHFDGTIFDDQSQTPITKARPPFQGSFIPEAALKRQPSLSSFNGKSVKGVWQLVVRGSRSERWGMLHSWELIVTPVDDMMDSENESAEVSASTSPAASATAAVSQSAPQKPEASGAAAQTAAARASMSREADSRKSDARRVAMERYQQILKSREGMTGTEAKQIYMQKYGSGDKGGKSGYGKEKKDDNGKKYEKFQKDKSDYTRGG
ncbi:proprotein convertase P-domain-containing protein [Pseudomonadales bacterium]|nr:proprotein convertase P-domain-containing protein [Rubripirellula sp.]MDB4494493.1 proprotein convertase P-domain-containing protein [Pseudomonadales bacterium]MDB4654426.1 proprotein convertase P-domain-containing protein [Rubripirellula sp.]MDB4654436.1 proprotein convertase P-domain-containing protein [Rubripirellula sp.]MDC0288496.1 proprotein convertase P-domain-containing protein [Rubripirellula sp.]